MCQPRVSKSPGVARLRATVSALRVLAAGAVSGALLAGARPAWAQGEPLATIPPMGDGAAALGALTWVQVTFAAVISVLSLWVLGSATLWVAGRMRWVTRYRQNRLARALQVALGGLLLMAVLLPYLVEHHPMIALVLPLMGIFTLLAVNLRADDLADQNPSL